MALFHKSLITASVVLWSMAASAGMTSQQCDVDLKELLSEIENNRVITIADIEKQLADDVSPVDPQGLEALREQTWDQEEQQRGQANYIWRDCMLAVKNSNKKQGGSPAFLR